LKILVVIIATTKVVVTKRGDVLEIPILIRFD
jgi:hypothetical protein